MKAFFLVVLLIATAPAFGQSERYMIDTAFGWGAATGDTWHWCTCAEGAATWGTGMLDRIDEDRDLAIEDTGWNIRQLDQLREQYEAGKEPEPPSYLPGTSVASNGWILLRRVANIFGLAVDAYTYWIDNKNYKASVLYAKIHDIYNGKVGALDERMRARTEHCVYSKNYRGGLDEKQLDKYDIGYAGDNFWLAYPVPRKGVVTVQCVANC